MSENIEQSAAQTAPATNLYDAQAEQKYTFTADEDLEITHIYKPLSDERFFEFDRNSRLKLVDDGTNVISDNAKALGDLFDDQIIDVLGFEGEKPENWKAELDIDRDKIPSVSFLLTVSAFSEAKRGWGQAEGVSTEAWFNGKVTRQKHFLRKKTAEDVRDFRKFQKIPIASKAKGLVSGETVIPSNAKGKADLYDRMMSQPATGYAGSIVPAWHKAAVIDHLFSSGLTAKK